MIKITKPSTEAVENLLPLCYYDDFKLCWNSDSKNKNGVIVIIEWIGEMVIDNESFNIMVESHEFLNFVLIREIKHI